MVVISDLVYQKNWQWKLSAVTLFWSPPEDAHQKTTVIAAVTLTGVNMSLTAAPATNSLVKAHR